MQFLPLESNPQVMQEFMEKLGLDGAKFGITDVWGLDDELLGFVPKPAFALLLLYPITDATMDDNDDRAEKMKEELKPEELNPKDIFFMEQTIGNACGTVGLIHATLNNLKSLNIKPNSWLDSFMSKVMDEKHEQKLNHEEIGKLLLQKTELTQKLSEKHQETAEKGEVEIVEEDLHTNLHFVCFVEKKGFIYELDGRLDFPIRHVSIADFENDFLKAAASVIKEKMNLIPDANQFSIVAFHGK